MSSNDNQTDPYYNPYYGSLQDETETKAFYFDGISDEELWYLGSVLMQGSLFMMFVVLYGFSLKVLRWRSKKSRKLVHIPLLVMLTLMLVLGIMVCRLRIFRRCPHLITNPEEGGHFVLGGTVSTPRQSMHCRMAPASSSM